MLLLGMMQRLGDGTKNERGLEDSVNESGQCLHGGSTQERSGCRGCRVGRPCVVLVVPRTTRTTATCPPYPQPNGYCQFQDCLERCRLRQHPLLLCPHVPVDSFEGGNDVRFGGRCIRVRDFGTHPQIIIEKGSRGTNNISATCKAKKKFSYVFCLAAASTTPDRRSKCCIKS